MVGTAEYQVTECASTRGQKAWALGDRRATGAHDEHDGGEHSADHGLTPCRAGQTDGRAEGKSPHCPAHLLPDPDVAPAPDYEATSSRNAF
jgi:hypothetical protein